MLRAMENSNEIINCFIRRFTQELLTNIHKGLQARLDLGEKSEKDQIDLAEAHKIRINVIVDECKQVKQYIHDLVPNWLNVKVFEHQKLIFIL